MFRGSVADERELGQELFWPLCFVESGDFPFSRMLSLSSHTRSPKSNSGSARQL